MKRVFWSSVLAVFFTFVNAHAAILAKVGAKDITDEDIRNEYPMITSQQKDALNGDYNAKKGIVDTSVNAELMVQSAEKAGLDKDSEYKKALERFRKQYLATKTMEKNIEPKLTKSNIRKFFEDNKAMFDSTEACASHIVVKDESTAEKVLKEVKANGAKFDEIAKNYSLDPSVGENKGNLGCFTRDRMVSEFSAAVFNMKKTEIRGPVHTMYGYHIIKLNDVKPGKVPNFEEVEQKAKEAYRMKVYQEMVAGLRAKAAVKYNEDAIKSFKF